MSYTRFRNRWKCAKKYGHITSQHRQLPDSTTEAGKPRSHTGNQEEQQDVMNMHVRPDCSPEKSSKTELGPSSHPTRCTDSWAPTKVKLMVK